MNFPRQHRTETMCLKPFRIRRPVSITQNGQRILDLNKHFHSECWLRANPHKIAAKRRAWGLGPSAILAAAGSNRCKVLCRCLNVRISHTGAGTSCDVLEEWQARITIAVHNPCERVPSVLTSTADEPVHLTVEAVQHAAKAVSPEAQTYQIMRLDSRR